MSPVEALIHRATKAAMIELYKFPRNGPQRKRIAYGCEQPTEAMTDARIARTRGMSIDEKLADYKAEKLALQQTLDPTFNPVSIKDEE